MERKTITTTTNSIKIEEVLQQLLRGEVLELHFIGILKGRTIYRDRKSNKLCLANHKIIQCYDLNQTKLLENILEELLKNYEKVVILR